MSESSPASAAAMAAERRPASRYLSADLPGTGGVCKASPEDFQVEEVPAYLPAGAGEHTMLFVEKRGLTTQQAVAAICKALGARPDHAGIAGLKDRHALTRQWISLHGVDPAAAAALDLDVPPGRVRVLAAGRHGNKLRTGHLRGNRFALTIRRTTDGVARAGAILALLLREGTPNRYGEQRFGAGERNALDGRRLLLGELRVSDRFRRRLLTSAIQSALFNRYYDDRQRDGLLLTVLLGDVVQKTDTGGVFTVGPADLEDAQRRLDQGLLAVTGPMFGSRMTAPLAGTPAAAREEAVLTAEGLSREIFTGPLAEGTRRPLLIRLRGPEAPAEVVAAHPDDPTAIVLRFTLPPGAYATVVLDEVMKTQPAARLIDGPAALQGAGDGDTAHSEEGALGAEGP